jgi:hypothetical protein
MQPDARGRVHGRTDLALLKGALDLHVHTHPSRDPRPWDDLQAAESLREASMRGYVIKDHHGPTAVRAYHTRIAVPEVETYGSLCLNLASGGLDPFVVEAQIDYGVKVIWMPTVNSLRHQEFFGGPSLPGYPVASKQPQEPLTVLDTSGNVKAEVRTILKLIAEADISLHTGHLGLIEQRAVIDAALELGVRNVVITHANFIATRMPLEMQLELTGRGAMVEYCLWTGRWHSQDPGETAEWIRSVGPERVILSSDSGSYWSAHPAEHMRLFVSTLLMEGIEPDAISRMITVNPAIALGLDPEPQVQRWSLGSGSTVTADPEPET